MSEHATVDAARAQSEAARERLFATLGRLQHRLSPSVLASDAVETVKDRAAALAAQSVAEVRARPVAAAAAAGALALLLTRRLWWPRRRGTSAEDATSAERAS